MFIRSTLTAFAFTLLLMVSSCNPSEPVPGFYLSGNIAQNRGEEMVLYRIDTTTFQPIDSINIHADGAFSFFVETEKGDFYFLGKGRSFSSPFPAFFGDSIQISLTNEKATIIKGGLEAGRYSVFTLWLGQGEERFDSLSKSLEKARYTADYASVREKSDSVFDQIRSNLKEDAVEFIHSNPDLLSNILVINSSLGRVGLFDESIDFSLFFEVDSLLQVYHGNNVHVVNFHNRVRRLREKVARLENLPASLSFGAKAPNIVTPGTSGKISKLHDNSAKLTLIYFWNPSDISGRQSNMELKLLHEKYKSAGFAVFGVAFDPDIARFKNAINMDKLWWTNVNDTLGMQSPVLETYQVDDFPSLVLMDKKGNIAGRFLSVKALAHWMDENFEFGNDTGRSKSH